MERQRRKSPLKSFRGNFVWALDPPKRDTHPVGVIVEGVPRILFTRKGRGGLGPMRPQPPSRSGFSGPFAEIDGRSTESQHKDEHKERRRIRGECAQNLREGEPILGRGLREEGGGGKGVKVQHDGTPDRTREAVPHLAACSGECRGAVTDAVEGAMKGVSPEWGRRPEDRDVRTGPEGGEPCGSGLRGHRRGGPRWREELRRGPEGIA
jgi:hypothetical protein